MPRLPVEEQCCVCLALFRKGKWKPRRTCPSLCCSSLSVGFLCIPSTVCRPSARIVRSLKRWRTSASSYHMPTQPWIRCCTHITCGILELLWRACCAVCSAPRKIMQETVPKASDSCWLLCFLDKFLRQVPFMYVAHSLLPHHVVRADSSAKISCMM